MAKLDLASLDDAGLIAKLAELDRKSVEAKFAHSMGQLENTAVLAELRKTVARIKSEIRRRELAQGLDKGSLESKYQGVGSEGAASASGSEEASFLQSVVDKASE